MTRKSEGKVCGMHKKCRMGLGCALMAVKCKSKVFKMQRRAGWSWDPHR